jgi:rhodanese-related sulfurtransferase
MSDITVQELHDRMQKKEALNIIDVREVYEYEEFNINAKNIPLGELPGRMSEVSTNKDEEIIIHCRSGARSGQAKMYLMSEGFTNVRNLLGGMLSWQSEIND